jgi:hypothetical protein
MSLALLLYLITAEYEVISGAMPWRGSIGYFFNSFHITFIKSTVPPIDATKIRTPKADKTTVPASCPYVI